MANAVDQVDPLDALAEEFLSRRRRGERPSLDEYASLHPDLAERIHSLFPTLEAIEALGAHLEGDNQPDRLGEYRIVRPLGRGGMGVVYEAVQEPLGRRVALKVLAGEPRSKSSLLERFQREARTAARLHHGNIVPVFGVGVDAGIYYIAMQFIDGQALDKVIEEIRQIRAGHGSTSSVGSTWLSNDDNNYERKVVALIVQAADAVAYAHSRGVLHRDIKPSNLLLDISGTLWVADFGLAKEVGAEDITTTGDVVGTLKYLAPERLTGAADERSDVYSLGATLYELLTLRPAFAGLDRPALLEQITRGDPVSPRRIIAGMTPDLETVVLKALAREPTARYASAAALAEDLRNVIADRPIRARRLSLPARAGRWAKRNPLIAGLTGLVAALLLTVLGLSLWHGQRLGTALIESDRKRLESLITEARAVSRSRQQGQRHTCLNILHQAAALADQLGTRAEIAPRLRDIALTALCRTDVVTEPLNSAIPIGIPIAIDIAPDYQHYAVIEKDGPCRVIATADGQLAHEISVVGSPSFLQFAHDSRYLAIVSKDKHVQVWAVNEARPRLAMTKSAGVIDFAANNQLVVLADDITVKTYAGDGQELGRFTAPLEYYQGNVRGHPRQSLIALYSYVASAVEIRELPNGELKARWPIGGVTGVAWTPDGERCAVADYRGTVHEFQIGAVRAVRSIPVEHAFECFTYSPRGDRIVGRGWRDVVTLVDTFGSQPAYHEPCTRLEIPIRWSRDNSHFGIGQEENRLVHWHIADDRSLTSLRAHVRVPDMVYCGLAIHPQVPLAVSSVSGGGLGFWDLTTGQQLGLAAGESFTSLQFDPAGNLFVNTANATMCWPMKVIDAAVPVIQLAPLRPLPLHAGEYLCISADGTAAAAPRRIRDGTNIWQVGADRPVTLPVDDECRVELSRDGRQAVSRTFHSCRLTLWNARTGARIRELRPRATDIQFTPDGRWLWTSTEGGRLLDANTWEDGPCLGESLTAPAFSADGTRAAIQPRKGVIHWIEVPTGRVLARLEEPTEQMLFSLIVSPDGRRLMGIANEVDRGIRMWDLLTLERNLQATGLATAMATLAKNPPTTTTEARLRIENRSGALGFQFRSISDHVENSTSHQEGLHRGWSFLQQRQFSEALGELEPIARTAATDSRVQLTLAATYHGLNRTDDAIAAYRRVEHLGALPWSAAVALAELYQRPGPAQNLVEAERLARSLLELSPCNSLALMTLGLVLESTGQLDESRMRLETARNQVTDWTHLRARLILARVYARLGRRLDALAEFGHVQKEWTAQQNVLMANRRDITVTEYLRTATELGLMRVLPN